VEPVDAAVCVNIGPAQRRKRLLLGVASLVLGAALVISMSASGMPRWVRLSVVGFFLVGFTGVFQARARTCVALAARGLRNLDGGAERIEDDAELSAVRARARRVQVQSAIATLVATALAMVLP
jgi:hypothetical protein